MEKFKLQLEYKVGKTVYSTNCLKPSILKSNTRHFVTISF